MADATILQDGKNVLKIRAVDLAGNWSGEGTGYTLIDSAPPILWGISSSSEPDGNGTLEHAEDFTSGISSVVFGYREECDDDYIVATITMPDPTPFELADGSFIPTGVMEVDNQSHTFNNVEITEGVLFIKVEVTDLAQNIGFREYTIFIDINAIVQSS
jgi:hypothetical protein